MVFGHQKCGFMAKAYVVRRFWERPSCECEMRGPTSERMICLVVGLSEEGPMARRLKGAPLEEDMIIANSESIGLKKPYMRGRLKANSQFWRECGADARTMEWVEYGFELWFKKYCPRIRKKNQPSCFESKAQEFITKALVELQQRGVVAKWESKARGEPRVVSPLKVVPKGEKFRLILDLSKLNKHLSFPSFKYDSIRQVEKVFELGDWLFAWDCKDGYFHMDMAESMFTYMCFEWEGVMYYFAQCPNGLAPACWAFTKLTGVGVKYLRAHGLKCLRYIDDGVGGARGKEEAERLRDLTVKVITSLGWVINFEKSELVVSRVVGFIGYTIDTVGRGQGLLSPSLKRDEKLKSAVKHALRARQIAPRVLAQATGHIVALRPCLDPMAMLFTRQLNIEVARAVDSTGWDWRVKLGEGAREELKIWLACYEGWKAKPIWVTGQPTKVQAQDASDTAVGGWLGDLSGSAIAHAKGQGHRIWFTQQAKMAAGRLEKQDLVMSSTYRELYAILFMVRTFRDDLAGHWVRVQADNQALYYIASKGSASDLRTHELLVELFWLCEWAKIKWDIVWLPRELNQLADDLSKWVDQDDWQLNGNHWRVVCKRLGPFDCDCFASEQTNLLPRFNALVWSPNVWERDTFINCREH